MAAPPTPRIARKVSAFLEIEADGYGTGLPAAVANWNAALHVRLRKRPKPVVEHFDQDREHYTPWFSKSDTIPGPRLFELELEVELAGSGAAATPAPIGKFLRVCGFAETIIAGPPARVEYTPADSGESAVIRFWQDGVAYLARGCRGNGQIVMDAYEVPHFVGKVTGFMSNTLAEVWGGNPSDPFDAWKQPLLPMTSNSIDVTLGCTYAGGLSGGTGYPSLGLSIDIGNKVEFIPLLSGEQVAITDRLMTGKSKMMLTPAQEVTWRADIAASTEISLGWRIGTVAGQKVGVFAPRVQRLKPVFEEYKGFLLVSTDLAFLAKNGLDEVKIWTA
jgi:hypothetical protein